MSGLSLGQFLSAATLVGAAAGIYGHQLGTAQFKVLEAQLDAAKAKHQTIQHVTMPTVHTERIEYRDRIQKIEVPKIVEREVYKNVCLDEDGVKAFNTFMGSKHD